MEKSEKLDVGRHGFDAVARFEWVYCPYICCLPRRRESRRDVPGEAKVDEGLSDSIGTKHTSKRVLRRCLSAVTQLTGRPHDGNKSLPLAQSEKCPLHREKTGERDRTARTTRTQNRVHSISRTQNIPTTLSACWLSESVKRGNCRRAGVNASERSERATRERSPFAACTTRRKLFGFGWKRAFINHTHTHRRILPPGERSDNRPL